MSRKVNKDTLDLMQTFEGLEEKRSDGRIYAYHDCIGLPTIGIGHLLSKIKNESLDKYPSITLEEAYDLFDSDVNKFAVSISNELPIELSDNEFGAIVSLVFNIGIGNFNSSTLKKKLLANADKNDCGNEFLRWNKAGGKVITGLTRRRTAEKELFLKV